MPESTARLRFLRIAPRKVRLVADLIRGKNVEEALNVLQFTPKRGARSLAKLLKAAVADADQGGKVNVDKLYVRTVFVDDGPVMKRWMARAMGRATPIRKRTAHVTLRLDQRA
jgi:large subunit ribosomal protein L22